MTFVVWARYKRNKRYDRLFTTNDSARADMVATNAAKECIYGAVKVVCNDDYTSETLIYK